jgi:RHS repeat-associated protein
MSRQYATTIFGTPKKPTIDFRASAPLYQDGYYINDDGSQNATHKRIIDLGPLAGKTISTVAVDADQDTQVGSQWNIVFEQLVLTSADGTVHPIYTGESSVTFASITGTTSVTGRGYSIDSNPGKGTSPQLTTLYYHQDNLGTTRTLTAGGGWPVWQGIFQPYGQEYNPEIGVESHKFTGKERDSESGLDYFGARYYGSNMGRWLSPDWADAASAVPYADYGNPQTLNLYGYVKNDPETYIDPDGHVLDGGGRIKSRENGGCLVSQLSIIMEPLPPPPSPPQPPKPPAVVLLNGHTVTDSRVNSALSAISIHFASSTVNVTSGDRNFVPTGGAKNSAHLTGQAADFHIVGKSDSQVHQSLKDSNSPVSTGFRLIQHGPDTVTQGAHLHLDSRNEGGRPTNYMHEGMTPSQKGVYSHDQ